MQEQLILPFGYKYAEDRASLLIAIRAAGLRRLDQAFVLMVLDLTSDAWLHKTYNELAERLHVSRSTVWRSVQRCVDAGLVVAMEERYRTGGQRDNAYAIDWEGVRAYCFNSTLFERPGVHDTPPPVAAVHREVPPVQIEQPPLHREVPPVQIEQPYKEYIPPKDPSIKPPPPSDAPVGGGGFFVDDWDQIKARLVSLGMADAVGAIAAVRRAGHGPRDVASVIDEWEASRPAWHVGALHWRLTRGSWPAKAEGHIQAERAKAAAKRRESVRMVHASQQAQVEREAAEAEELERLHGPALDGMSPGERDDLAAVVYPPGFAAAYYARNRDSPAVRRDLLLALDAQGGRSDEAVTSVAGT